MKILVVVDMQNDFIDGTLGTKEAVQIVNPVLKKIKEFEGVVIATRDTHDINYLETQEGRNLPIEHCVKGTKGWQIREEIASLLKTEPVDKVTFGSAELPERIRQIAKGESLENITLIGLCTDICVISNAMLLKAFFPEVPLIVDASCCAGVTPESHLRALEAMKVCQISVENENGQE